MTPTIHFLGKEYTSVEDMTPQIRQAYEKLSAALKTKLPGQDIDQIFEGESDQAFTIPDRDERTGSPLQAWGGQREQGSVAVPLEFDNVASLGPATAVYGHNSAELYLFGASKVKVLVLYGDGFAYQTGAKDIHIWHWDEVAVIQSNVRMTSDGHGYTGHDHEYTLIKRNGEKLLLNDVLKDVEEIIEPIKRNVFALLLSPLTQQYDSGQAVTFGPVTIHRQNGVQINGKSYAWNDIMDIKVERGRFIITLRDSKQHEVRVSAIPNIELLCQMIGLKLLSPQLAYY